MSDCCVLDACTVIAFLSDEAGADIVEELLRKFKSAIAQLSLVPVKPAGGLLGIYRDVGPEAGSETLGKVR